MSVFRTILCGLLAASMSVPVLLSGEIAGHVLITKTLTKKKVTLPAYQMRSAALPMKEDTGRVVATEFDRLAIFLEDPGLSKAALIPAEVLRESVHFSPVFLAVCRASAFSFSDPIAGF